MIEDTDEQVGSRDSGRDPKNPLAPRAPRHPEMFRTSHHAGHLRPRGGRDSRSSPVSRPHADHGRTGLEETMALQRGNGR